MTNTEKQERLDQLLVVAKELKEKEHPIPSGMQLTINKLTEELGLSSSCDLDGDCLNCGS